jgi:hypothetical protein
MGRKSLLTKIFERLFNASATYPIDIATAIVSAVLIVVIVLLLRRRLKKKVFSSFKLCFLTCAHESLKTKIF